MYKKYLMNGLIGASAVVMVGARVIPGTDQPGPVLTKAVELVTRTSPVMAVAGKAAVESDSKIVVETAVESALSAFANVASNLSHPKALETAMRGYFAFKSAHPEEVRKPYLYFVDYGLPSTQARGYVFDMQSMKIVEGPFMVAHGRGSSTSQFGTPTRFSNSSHSAATSLGLYVTQATYGFTGHIAGGTYSSIGLRLLGKSGAFNSNALARGVVAHGAPYVTASRAGRSEGCPAMDPARAQRLLPKLANGAVVFLFAPDQNWMSTDPWVTAS